MPISMNSTGLKINGCERDLSGANFIEALRVWVQLTVLPQALPTLSRWAAAVFFVRGEKFHEDRQAEVASTRCREATKMAAKVSANQNTLAVSTSHDGKRLRRATTTKVWEFQILTYHHTTSHLPPTCWLVYAVPTSHFTSTHRCHRIPGGEVKSKRLPRIMV